MGVGCSFAPLVGDGSGTLILGSLPGAESLRRGQYYAHPCNVFWKILFAAFGGEFCEDYSLRCEFVLSNNLALWDICASAYRVGSADDRMSGIVANDIAGPIGRYPCIKRIVLNGRKAEKEYRRLHGNLTIPAVYAPSTSPAFAAMSFDEKLVAWRKALFM